MAPAFFHVASGEAQGDERTCRRYGLPPPTLSGEGLRRLRAHSWPGNVRELANEVERAVVFGDPGALDFGRLPPATGGGSTDWLQRGFAFPETGFSLEAVIDDLVQRALSQAGGNVSAAARLLGVTRDYLRYRIKADPGSTRRDARPPPASLL